MIRRLLVALALAIALLFMVGFRSAIPFAILAALAGAGIVATRGAAQYVCIVVATLGVTFCVVECVATVIEPKIEVDHPGSNAPRPTIGWGPSAPGAYRARRSLAGAVHYDVVYTIDERLLRKVVAGTTGKGVAFFGDSFVFGTGVDDKDTLPQLFADDTGHAFPVFNLGVAGWSAANVFAELRSGLVDDVLAKTRLTVQFVAPWHAERTGCGSALSSVGPRFTLVNDKLEPAPPCRERASALSMFAFYRVLIAPHLRRVDDDDIARLVALTQATIRASIETYKQPMIIYYLRDPAYLAHTSWTDDKIVAAFRSAGAQILDYSIADGNDPKYRIQGDGHPTPFANRIRADRLAAFVRAHDPEILAEPAAAPR